MDEESLCSNKRGSDEMQKLFALAQKKIKSHTLVHMLKRFITTMRVCVIAVLTAKQIALKTSKY
jgi:hypothetical protein